MRSAWALADLYYLNNQADKSGEIKAEAWKRVQEDDSITRMLLEDLKYSKGLEDLTGMEDFNDMEDLKNWDKAYLNGRLDSLVVFSQR